MDFFNLFPKKPMPWGHFFGPQAEQRGRAADLESLCPPQCVNKHVNKNFEVRGNLGNTCEKSHVLESIQFFKKKVSFDIWFWAGLWIQHFETKAVAIHTRKLRPCQFKQTTHREQPRLKFKRRPCNFGLNKFEARQKLQDVYSVFSGKMMDDGWNF